MLYTLQMPHTPHTPHTPQSTPHTPAGGASGPPSVPPASQESTGNHNTSGNTINNDTAADIPSDLNFDPAAVIDGEGTGQEALNVSISHHVKFPRYSHLSRTEIFF